MIKHYSRVRCRGDVVFPEYTGERIYMREIRKGKLPFDLARWQPTVDAMLDGVDVTGPIYMMVDQSEVKPNTSHRRPGVHIDGYWLPAIQAHGGGGHIGDWKTGDWKQCSFEDKEALILASDVQGAIAYEGEWEGKPNNGGDCSHINTSGMEVRVLNPNKIYAGNVTMLHESIPIPYAAKRTLIRLNVPGWHP